MFNKWIVFKGMFPVPKCTVRKWTAITKYKNNSIFLPLKGLSFSEPNHITNTSEINSLEIKDKSLTE